MRILVTGAGGQLGAYLLRELAETEHEMVAWRGRKDVDLTSPEITDTFIAAAPDAVIHAAAMSRPADAAAKPKVANEINNLATGIMAHLADRTGARFVFVSTDMIFDGEHAPYTETGGLLPNPQVYGRTKLKGEAQTCACYGTILRVSLLYGPSLNGKANFFDQQVAALRDGRPVKLFHDEWRTPLDYRSAARALITLAEAEPKRVEQWPGDVYHLGGPERMSRVEFGRRLARYLGVSDACVEEVSRLSVQGDEPRPRDLSLDSSKFITRFPHLAPPRFEDALRQML